LEIFLKKTLGVEKSATLKEQTRKTVLVGLRPHPLHDQILFKLGSSHSLRLISNGLDLVRLIPEERPSLILLESDLPGLSGFQVAQLVKGHPTLHAIPIIIIVSQGYQIGQFWAKEARVDFCQPAPLYDPEKLSEIALKLVREFNTSSISEEAWEKLSSELSGDGVLAALSEILDEHLLESTIANHIARLSQGSTDLRNLVRSIMLLLRDILEYDAGAIHLFKQSEIYTFVAKGKPEDEHKVFLQNVIEYGDIYNVHLISDENVQPSEVPLGKFPPAYHDEGENPTIFTIPLEVRQGIIGTLTLETFKSAVKRDYYLRMLELITQQIALALDDALLYQEVHRLSTVDELTKLPNRRAFYALIEKEIIRTIRFKLPLSVAILDIDFFKNVNDTYGHLQGDCVLSECARIFNSSIREKIDTVARFGGEEFIILLPQTDNEKSRIVVERLRTAIEQHSFRMIESDGSLKVTVSVGLASIDGKTAHTLDEIINAADKALYKAKESGRNQIVEISDLD